MNSTDAIPRRCPRSPDRARRPALRVLAAVGAVLAFVSGCAAPMPGTAPAPPVPAPGAAGELTEEDVNAWLDGLVPASLETAGIAGAAVSVVHDGEILTSRGYGYSDTGVGHEYGETAAGDIVPLPVDPDGTLFRVGSVTKPFTATAVMQLVEAGDLDLDADVNEYLDFTLETSFDEAVTLRHLLTHTAGFEERFEGMIQPEGTDPDLREHVTDDPPEQVYRPGTVPAYSNYGYALAGYVVERVSQTPFEDYVDENVLAPIRMDSSSVRQPLPDDLRDSLSEGYTTDDGGPRDFETVGGAPAGALSATATDMARFMLAHLNTEGTDGPALLEPDTLALMHEPALDEETLGNMAEGPRMALGFFEEDRNGHRILGHGGDTRFFHTHMQIYPEDGAGVFVTLNSGGREATSSLRLREAVTSGFADRYFPAEEREETPSSDGEPVPEQSSRDRAETVAGTYVSSRTVHSNFMSVVNALGGTMVTARSDGTILVVPGPETGRPTAYEEVQPWVWREVGGQRLLTARVEDDRVSALGYGAAFTLLRADPPRSVTVALPVLALSMTVLVVAVLSWPVGAVVRWRLSRPGRERAGRLARVLTRIAMGVAVAAAVGWAVAISMIAGFQDVPPAVLRVLQAAQLVGMAGAVPAAVVVFDNVRRRVGWGRCVGSVLVLAALVGCGWFAVTFRLVAPSV
ncbi:serine hydrolase, partial [Nocardiopsis halotolerans]|uniref:serine hydrolase n=1 Tax=Nocardiopsis halotolerans TaxID=124252 RepID=UPI000A06170D